MKKQFKKDFKEKEAAYLQLFSRTEICERFNIDDGDDNLRIFQKILEKIPQNTCIFFDETPLAQCEGSTPSFNWSDLKNTRPGEISVIIAMQPLRQKPTLKLKQQNPIWPNDVVKLELAYRSSQQIHEFNSNLLNGKVPLEYIDVKTQTSDTIRGPGVKIFPIDGQSDISLAKKWIRFQLFTINCIKEQLKILHTDETTKDAKSIFLDSEFQSCIRSLKCYQACESDVIVAFFSKDNADNYGKLLELTSRAKYQVRQKYYYLKLNK